MDSVGEKYSKFFPKIFERQNLQNQKISDLYNDDNKSNYSNNPKDIFKSAKNLMKNFTPRTQLPKLLIFCA